MNISSEYASSSDGGGGRRGKRQQTFKHYAVLRAKFTTGDNIDFLKWWTAKL